MDRRGVAVAQQGKRCEGDCLTNLLQATGVWLCRSVAMFRVVTTGATQKANNTNQNRAKRRLCNTAQATACHSKTRLTFAPTPFFFDYRV